MSIPDYSTSPWHTHTHPLPFPHNSHTLKTSHSNTCSHTHIQITTHTLYTHSTTLDTSPHSQVHALVPLSWASPSDDCRGAKLGQLEKLSVLRPLCSQEKQCGLSLLELCLLAQIEFKALAPAGYPRIGDTTHQCHSQCHSRDCVQCWWVDELLQSRKFQNHRRVYLHLWLNIQTGELNMGLWALWDKNMGSQSQQAFTMN